MNLSTWDSFGSTFTYVVPSTVEGFIETPSSSDWKVSYSTWSLDDYSKMVAEEAKLRAINKILDKDMEQYMVFPGTSTEGLVGTWNGWCLSGGLKPVPVVCP